MKVSAPLSISIILCSLVLNSCSEDDLRINKETSFNTPFKSSLQEHTLLRNDQSQVFVALNNISDMRCTQHVSCNDPGVASVRIELSNLGNSRAETILHLGSYNNEKTDIDSVAISLDQSQYMIYLHKVNPHPSENSEENQTAELSVKLIP